MAQDRTQPPQDKAAAALLASRLPAQVFDAHAHLQPPGKAPHGGALTRAGWRRDLGRQVGLQRLIGGLFFPMPGRGQPVKANDWILNQKDWQAQDRLLVLAAPDMPRPEFRTCVTATTMVKSNSPAKGRVRMPRIRARPPPNSAMAAMKPQKAGAKEMPRLPMAWPSSVQRSTPPVIFGKPW